MTDPYETRASAGYPCGHRVTVVNAEPPERCPFCDPPLLFDATKMVGGVDVTPGNASSERPSIASRSIPLGYGS